MMYAYLMLSAYAVASPVKEMYCKKSAHWKLADSVNKKINDQIDGLTNGWGAWFVDFNDAVLHYMRVQPLEDRAVCLNGANRFKKCSKVHSKFYCQEIAKALDDNSYICKKGASAKGAETLQCQDWEKKKNGNSLQCDDTLRMVKKGDQYQPYRCITGWRLAPGFTREDQFAAPEDVDCGACQQVSRDVQAERARKQLLSVVQTVNVGTGLMDEDVKSILNQLERALKPNADWRAKAGLAGEVLEKVAKLAYTTTAKMLKSIWREVKDDTGDIAWDIKEIAMENWREVKEDAADLAWIIRDAVDDYRNSDGTFDLQSVWREMKDDTGDIAWMIKEKTKNKAQDIKNKFQDVFGLRDAKET